MVDVRVLQLRALLRMLKECAQSRNLRFIHPAEGRDIRALVSGAPIEVKRTKDGSNGLIKECAQSRNIRLGAGFWCTS